MSEGVMIERVNNGWVLRWMFHESMRTVYQAPPDAKDRGEIREGLAPDFGRGLVTGSAYVYSRAEKEALLESLKQFLND